MEAGQLQNNESSDATPINQVATRMSGLYEGGTLRLQSPMVGLLG
jgi:hypothetical protein